MTQKPPKLWPRTLQRSTPSSPRIAPAPRTIEAAREGGEVGEVLGRLGGGEAGQRSYRRGAAGPALVEHQDAEVLQRPREPARRARVPRRPRRREAGAALEEDEERPVGAAGVGALGGEDGDRHAARPVMVERER